MSNPSPAVYHCPSCGALAKADPGSAEASICVECGHEFRRPIRVAPRNSGSKGEGLGKFVQRDVVSRRRLVERDQAVVVAELPPPMEVDKIVPERGEHPDEEIVSDDGRKKVIRRRKRKRRVNRRPYVFAVLWLLVVVAAFFYLRHRFDSSLPPRGETPTNDEAAEKAKAAEERAKAAEVQGYLQKHIGECRNVLGEFLRAPDMAGRAQSVYDPLRITLLMDRFTSERAMRRPQGTLKIVKQGLIIRDSFRAIETLWEAADGEAYEVTFIRSEGTWRIDWEAFTIYSTTPWQFFVKQAGPNSGEFRVFVREVALTSQADVDMMGVRFYPPISDATLRHRRQSDTVLVPAASVTGQQLRAVLSRRDEAPGWGDPSMFQGDPPGLARVRVALEWRAGEGGEKNLVIRELKAGNWLAAGLEDDLGVEKEEPDEG